MRRFDTLDKRLDMIRKVVEDENDLNLDTSAKELVSMIEQESEIFIDSQMLKLGENKNIIFYEQIDLYDEDKMVDKLKEAMNFSAYKEFEVIIFVHNIEEKFKVLDNVKPRIEAFIKANKKSIKILEISTCFVGGQEKQFTRISIDSAIRIIEYQHREPDVIGQVYNANLYDLVELYNIVGDSLFKDNVRKKIENVLEVDTEISKTLEKNPENFWFFNNGVTLMICENYISQRREYQLDIEVIDGAELSIINGAQTISVAAQYYYKLKNRIAQNKEDQTLTQQLENIKKAKVLLRVIRKSKSKENNGFYKDVSISLNRQKAINEADIRYTDYLIEDINTLSENRYAPYFTIDKREDKNNKKRGRHYSVERFVKIAAIYLLQEPGSARAAKGKYIKQDTQWGRLKITDTDKSDIKNDIFLKRYTPFITVDKVFTKLNEKLILAGKKQPSQVFQNIFNYSAEFLTAYMIWVANNKNNEDFTDFPKKCDLMNEARLNSLINEYGKIIFKYLTIEKGLSEEEIDSNLFKKDSMYREVREYLDKNCDFLQRMIEGMFDITDI